MELIQEFEKKQYGDNYSFKINVISVSSFVNHYSSTYTITFLVFPFLYDVKVDVEDVDVDLEASSITSRRSNNISHCLYIS
ncbi:16433_t:CDS:2 [Entrophospora sp. SA101]|nr:7515_t:CDS:2 [Entrophospora sp. SA101]CAJ0745076.1 16433_t:CDS:2 [Entrophospora sp. SA101]